jgi:hypothetical protein
MGELKKNKTHPFTHYDWYTGDHANSAEPNLHLARTNQHVRHTYANMQDELLQDSIYAETLRTGSFQTAV